MRRCEDIAGAEVYSVSGTPVDCVKLAMHTLLQDRKVSVMLSGINHGSNAGNCVVYSGTMGAAFEACMIGVPAIGFSLLHHSWKADFSRCTPFVRMITESVLQRGLPHGVCLNVNIPARCSPKGVKVVKSGEGYWTEEYVDYKDPQGRSFYLLSGQFIESDKDNEHTDNYWLKQEYVTVVPVRPDPTALDMIDTISDMLTSDNG